MHTSRRYHAVPTVALLLLFLASVCSAKPNPEKLMKNGVAFAKRQFEQINRNPAAALAFGSMLESGGSPLSYLAASIQDPAEMPPFTGGKPTEPYSVAVFYDDQQGCFVIEGYTDNLEKPALVEKVVYQRAAKGATPRSPQAAAADPTAINNALLEASLNGNLETVTALIGRGADVNARSSEGGTPVMYACAKGHAAVVQRLLAAGADPKARASDQNTWPVIMLAAEGGSPDIMAMLLEKGADPNTGDPFKNTPLMLASLRGQAKIVEQLIQAGANLNAQETKNNNFPLLYAASRGHEEVAAALIRSGANVNLADKSGLTPLMSCAEKGYTGIAANLIKAKANLEASLTGKTGAGATALMLAAAKGQDEMVRLLLSSGANVKATDKNGAAADRYATHNGHTALAELIQAAGQGVIPKAPQVAATVTPGPPAAPAPSAAPAVTGDVGKRQALIGKNQKAADAMFGKPIGTMQQSDSTVVMYRNATIILRKNIITGVK